MLKTGYKNAETQTDFSSEDVGISDKTVYPILKCAKVNETWVVNCGLARKSTNGMWRVACGETIESMCEEEVDVYRRLYDLHKRKHSINTLLPSPS